MGLGEVHRTAGRKAFVTTDDVRGAGVRPQTFRRHARSLFWEPRHRGLWIPPGRELDHREEVALAIAATGPEVLVTGGSALFLAQIIDRPPAAAEVLLPAARRVADREGICLHRTTLYEEVRYQHTGGFRVAAVARSFADAAVHSTVDALCRDIATALRLRRCTLPAIRRELDMRMRFPGRRSLRIAHGLLTGELMHSEGERRGRRLLREAGLIPHRRPLTVELDGRTAAEIDIPFPQVPYGVEIDGPHHLLAHVASADRARDRLLERHGWTIDRFFWFEVEERPQWFVAQVTRRLAALRSSRH